MIKFFRKTRQNLLSNGKTGRYLKYAFGEIILVVAGILIALGLNNVHQTTQNEQYIATILTQIQKELSVDAQDAVRIANEYKIMDSLSRRILMDSVTVNEWASNRYYDQLVFTYVSFSTNKSGYNQLMNNLQIMPEKFKPLIADLNLLYVEYQNDIDDFNKELKNDAISEGQKIVDNVKDSYTWRISNTQDEEKGRYHLNDPFYRNQVLNFITNFEAIKDIAEVYKIKSIEIYKAVDSLLNVTRDSLPDHLKIIDKINGEMDIYLGEYETATISKGKDQLFFSFNDSGGASIKLPLYRHSDNAYFIDFNGRFMLITFSKTDNIPAFRMNHYSMPDDVFTKIVN
jgi:hypothetical protein